MRIRVAEKMSGTFVSESELIEHANQSFKSSLNCELSFGREPEHPYNLEGFAGAGFDHSMGPSNYLLLKKRGENPCHR